MRGFHNRSHQHLAAFVDRIDIGMVAVADVSQLQAFATVGRTAGRQTFQGAQDQVLAVSRRGRQHQSGAAGVHHDRHAILRAHLAREFCEAPFQERQLVLVLHRAGRIDQEDQVGRGNFRGRNPIALDADLQQMTAGVPRCRRDLGADLEWNRATGGHRIAVVEIIDHLLGPHGVGWRALAGQQHASDIAVAAGVDVDGKRANRIFGHELGRVVGVALVILGVGNRCRDIRDHAVDGWRWGCNGPGHHRERHGRGIVDVGAGLRVLATSQQGQGHGEAQR